MSNNGLAPQNPKLPFAYKYYTDIYIDTSSASVDISLPSFVAGSIRAVHTDGSPAAGYTILPQSANSELCVSKPIIKGGTTPCGSMNWRYVLQADANGKADFALFPKDAATGENFPTYFTVQNTLSLAGVTIQSPTYAISDGFDATVIVPDAISISGRVVSSDGTAVPNLIGTWHSPSGGTGYSTTDLNGDFSFPTVAAGNMTMVIDNIYDGAQDNVAGCFSLTTAFNLPASKNDLLVTLPPIVAVRVRVVDEDGNAVANAVVNAAPGPSNEGSMTLTLAQSPLNVPYFHSTLTEILNTREGASSGCRSDTRRTDSNGRTSMFYFQADMYITIFAADTTSRQAFSAPLSLLQDSEAVVVLPRTVSVNGFVKSVSSDKPLAVAGIKITMGALGQSISAYTNSDGYYSFPGTVVSGSQNVAISYSGLANSLVPSYWLFRDMHLPITDHTFTLNFTIPEIITFSAVVVDQLGNAVPGAQIFPYNKDYTGWYITGPAIQVPIIEADPSNVGPEQGQIYVGTDGPQNTITADANGHAQYSFFLTPSVSLRMGCRDPANSARANFTIISLDGVHPLQFVLPSPPSPPRAVNSTGQNSSNSDGTVTVNWQPPLKDGGFPLENYTVTVTPMLNSTSSPTLGVTVSPRLFSAVDAVSSEHVQASASASTTATAAGGGDVHPVSGKTSIQYSVSARKTSKVITGLAPGVTYFLSVAASNHLGKSKPAGTFVHVKGSAAVDAPTVSPTAKPSKSGPTLKPTSGPQVSTAPVPSSSFPSTRPTAATTKPKPTASPSIVPTTLRPSAVPSSAPTVPSSQLPSRLPSTKPSPMRSAVPSAKPSKSSPASGVPSALPSKSSTLLPSTKPSSVAPSALPSRSSSLLPSIKPSPSPTGAPSRLPSTRPSTTMPSVKPSTRSPTKK